MLVFMKQLIFIALIGITLLACNNTNNSCGQAYFGGEIINPNNDHVVLYDSSETPVDTLYLDENNRFTFHLENLNPGLHSFVHGGESQVVILEPNDSIMIRLNTLDFDESLVFTGKGSKKNNYLIELFVKTEDEEKLMYQLSRLEPEEFKTKVDSIKAIRHTDLNEFISLYPTSNLFKKVAKACIDYNYNAHFEIYPFRHYNNKEIISYKSLPADFYDYRAYIDYDDEDLKDFYPYYNFLFPHINNLALNEYFNIIAKKNSVENTTFVFNRQSLDYNLAKLRLIDSLIGSQSIKNNLLKYSTRNFLSYNSNTDESEAMYNSFLSKSTNDEHKAYIEKLYANLNKLRPGNTLPDVDVVNYANETYSIKDLIKKPTVIYFWSNAIKNHFKESHERVARLKTEYPNVDFIAININSNNASVWKRLLRQNKFPTTNEYRFRNPEAARKILAIHYINKVMVVDGDKTIVSSNAMMFSNEFKELLDLLLSLVGIFLCRPF